MGFDLKSEHTKKIEELEKYVKLSTNKLLSKLSFGKINSKNFIVPNLYFNRQ